MKGKAIKASLPSYFYANQGTLTLILNRGGRSLRKSKNYKSILDWNARSPIYSFIDAGGFPFIFYSTTVDQDLSRYEIH